MDNFTNSPEMRHAVEFAKSETKIPLDGSFRAWNISNLARQFLATFDNYVGASYGAKHYKEQITTNQATITRLKSELADAEKRLEASERSREYLQFSYNEITTRYNNALELSRGYLEANTRHWNKTISQKAKLARKEQFVQTLLGQRKRLREEIQTLINNLLGR